MQHKEQAIDSRRIAKNTLMLYVRMLLVMMVSLYTSRITLEALGVEDFGIYSVVGGVVTLFSFINLAMSTGTQRFITYAIGGGDETEVNRVFSSSLSIHIIIAFVIFILAESVGLWFLNNRLNIPVDRVVAANWVYQFSILTAMISITQVPYTASIIAQERMNVYAAVSIFDCVARLGVVYALLMWGGDKLVLYSGLYGALTVVVALVYRFYSVRNFTFARYKFYYDKELWRDLGEYAGWNIFGNLAVVGYMQGVNVVLNIFFGPLINSARAISTQVNSALMQFVSSFQVAMNPQIVKSYARGEVTDMLELMSRGSKLSFVLLWVISMPVMVNVEYFLNLWLVDVPAHTVVFTQLTILNSLIESLSGPLMTSIQATGRIKLYQSLVGGILLMNLPLSYLFLKLGGESQIVYYVLIGCTVVAFVARLFIVKRYLPFSVIDYVRRVLLPVSVLIAVGEYIIMSGYFVRDTLWGVMQSGIIVGVLSLLLSVFVVMNRNERQWVLRLFVKKGL